MFFISREKKGTFIILFLILLLGISLRIVNLDKFDFWFDEASTVLQAKNIEEIDFAQNNNPPLYVYFLHFWGKYFDSEYGLRLPSVIFGVMAILMIFILGRLLYTRKIGLISAFILAISPFHIYYSREVRRYSLLVLLSLIAVYFFIKAITKKQIRFWTGFVIFSILNIYCHYINVLNWLALVVFFFIIQKTLDEKLRKIGWISNFCILLSFMPWFFLTFTAVRKLENILSDYGIAFWGQACSSQALFMTFKNFSIGYNASPRIYLLTVALFFYFFIKGIFILGLKKEKELFLCLLCLCVPILVIFIISLFKCYYIDRFFISSSVFYYFIVAGGLSTLKSRKLLSILLLLCVLSALSLNNYYNNVLPLLRKAYAWEQGRQKLRVIAEYINEKYEEGDGIFHTCQNTMPSFIYYSNRLKNRKVHLKNRSIRLTFLEKSNELRFLEFTGYGQPTGKSYVRPFINEKRFWLIFSEWYFKNTEIQYVALLEWLNKNYKIIEKKEFNDSTVFLYAAK